jgi:Tol biopolymer transport system component
MPVRLTALLIALVTVGVPATTAEASFPGRNGNIALIQQNGPDRSDPALYDFLLETVGPTGGSSKGRLGSCMGVTDPRSSTCPFGPAYSADGARLVFVRGTRLATIKADGTGLKVLPAIGSPGDDVLDPAWGPDGRIVFTVLSGAHPHLEIWIANADGTSLTQLTKAGGQEPAWSVTNRILFVRKGRIYRIRPDGTHRKLLGKGSEPSWSPTGKRIVFRRKKSLFVMRADGTHRRLLTHHGSEPAWSPNGRGVAFVSPTGDVVSHIYTVKLNGRGRTRIWSGFGPDDSSFSAAYAPDWQPLP